MSMEPDNQQQKPARPLTIILAALLLFALLVLMFSMGVWVGQKRAEFSSRWRENYRKNFVESANGHGIFGSVISIDASTITVKDRDGVEKVVIISGAVKPAKISVGDMVVVIGSPDSQGQINARFIRVLPQGFPSSMVNNSHPYQS